MYTQIVVSGATGESLSASDKDTSLRESDAPSERGKQDEAPPQGTSTLKVSDTLPLHWSKYRTAVVVFKSYFVVSYPSGH